MSTRALPTVVFLSLSTLLSTAVPASEAAWKAGTARIKITPAAPHCRCGWGGHDREAEGTYHDLWVKILALEDARGRRGLMITSDVMGFSKVMYDAICDGLKQRCGLDRAQIKLTYALKFKAKYGPRTWVNGFSHDLTAYMPSARVWQEGGYEAGYLGEYGLPAMRWAGDLEDRITEAVERMHAVLGREN